MSWIKARWLQSVLVVHLCLLALMAAAHGPIVRLDHAYDRAMYLRITGTPEDICYLILQPGSSYVVAPIGVLVAAVLALRRRWIRLTGWIALLVGCVLLDHLLKPLFHRARPLNMSEFPIGSFPSGHALLATATWGMIVYLAWDAVSRKRRRWLLGIAALLICGTAAGLLLPGYHFLSDVAAGYCLGMVWLMSCIALVRSRESQ